MKLIKLTVKLFEEVLRDIDLPVIAEGEFVIESHDVEIDLPENETTAINISSSHGAPIKLELHPTDTGIEIFYDGTNPNYYWRIESIEVLEEC